MPIWSPDGRELFFETGDQLVVLNVTTQPTFTFGNPAAVPGVMTRPGLLPGGQFDIAPDGRIVRAVVPAPGPSAVPATPHIEVVLNWYEELKRLAPSAGGK